MPLTFQYFKYKAIIYTAPGFSKDKKYKNCQIILSKFDEMKIKYSCSEYPGGHTWPVRRDNLYNFAQLLFK